MEGKKSRIQRCYNNVLKFHTSMQGVYGKKKIQNSKMV